MTETSGVRGEMRAYTEENFLYLHPGIEVKDDDDFLEDVEIAEENFGSIDGIGDYVERKRSTA